MTKKVVVFFLSRNLHNATASSTASKVFNDFWFARGLFFVVHCLIFLGALAGWGCMEIGGVKLL